MAVQFSHEVAYYGMVQLDGVAILATSGSIGVSHDPIFSSGVWGAGWYNAAEQVSYANNSLRIEGDIGFELASGNIFSKIQAFAFTDRASTLGKNIKILPQGKAGYDGPAWCSSCSFNASEGAIVSGSMNYSSGKMDSDSWMTIDPNNPADPNRQTGSQLGVGGGTSAPGFKDVYPYWATVVKLGATPEGGVALPDIIDWSANYSSSIEFITLCQGKTEDPIEADYIMVGPMTSDGSFTMFTVANEISPTKFHEQKACRIEMAPGSDLSSKNYIDFANIVYSSGNTSVQTGGGYIQSDISFTGLGDGTAPPMEVS